VRRKRNLLSLRKYNFNVLRSNTNNESPGQIAVRLSLPVIQQVVLTTCCLGHSGLKHGYFSNKE
jgi:hypothetical protein